MLTSRGLLSQKEGKTSQKGRNIFKKVESNNKAEPLVNVGNLVFSTFLLELNKAQSSMDILLCFWACSNKMLSMSDTLGSKAQMFLQDFNVRICIFTMLTQTIPTHNDIIAVIAVTPHKNSAEMKLTLQTSTQHIQTNKQNLKCMHILTEKIHS